MGFGVSSWGFAAGGFKFGVGGWGLVPLGPAMDYECGTAMEVSSDVSPL